MKAAILHAPKSDLVIEDVEIAEPGPREVLVRTVAVGLCRSDLHFIDGAWPHPLPTIPGHEAAGIVEAVGSEVTRMKPGDPVIACFTAFCGSCAQCLSGHPAYCADPSTKRDPSAPPRLSLNGTPVHQFLNLSAFAEQMLIHENACVAIDPAMPLDRAALIGCAVTTGSGAVFNQCCLRPGETLAVIGCGGIGLAAINAAKIAGAGRIVAIDPVPAKRELALKLGATDAIDPASDRPDKQVAALTGGSVDHAIEAVGRPATVELAWTILRRGGTATVLGMIAPGETVNLPGPSFLQGKKLQGSLLGDTRFPIDMPRLVDHYLNGRLDLDALIAERLPLAQINEAVDRLRRGDAVRSVVMFE